MNQSGVLLPLLERTATCVSEDQLNLHGTSVRVRVVATAVTDTPEVTVTIQGKDAGGNYYTILADAAVTSATTSTLLVSPWTTASANAAAVDMLPRVWRIQSAHADTDKITYAVYYDTDG
jgi:hypothetical protein